MRPLVALFDLLLPAACAECRCRIASERALCLACDASLPRIGHALRAPAALDACVAAVDFVDPALGWIHRFKYPQPGLAGLDVASGAVVRALVREAGARAPGPTPDAILPIPLHPRRHRGRGFSPAALLARELARSVAARFDVHTLYRVRDTPTQTGLVRRARQRNVRGAFACRPAAPACVWLVDDVVTTGATLAEAARALRAAGSTRVVGVAVAATPMRG